MNIAKLTDTLFKKKTTLGVDLGHSAWKLCLLHKSSSRCDVRLVELLDERGQVAPHPHRGQEALESFPPGPLQLRLSYADTTVASCYLELPPLRSGELDVALPAAVARLLPVSLPEVDLYSVPVAPLRDPQKTALFVCSLPKRTVEEQKAHFLDTRGTVLSVEPTPLTLARAHAAGGETCLVVDCGFRYTHLVLLRSGQPYYSRNFRLAGADFTQAFQIGDRIAWPEAERRKRAYCTTDEYFQVEPVLQRWLLEIRRTWEHAARALPELEVSFLVLTGGSSQWGNLDRRLEQALRRPVRVPTWRTLPCADVQSPAAVFEASLGLAS